MGIAQNSAERLENTLDLIDDALRREDKYYDFKEPERTLLDAVKEQQRRFEDAMDDDFDTHGAIDALHALSGAINEYVAGDANKGVLLKASAAYRKLLSALGLFEKREAKTDDLTKDLIETISAVREQLRKEKNYYLSDKIRDDLAEAGVILSDTSEGTSWKINRH